MLRHPCILGGPNKGEQNQKSKPTLRITMMHHTTKRGFKDCPGFLNSTGRLGPKRGRKCYGTAAFSGVPNKGEQSQKSKPTLRITMMHHATKRGFRDCPGFLNSIGRLGPKKGRKCYVTPAFSGVPNKGEQNQKSKPTLRITMMHHATKRGFKDCPGFLNSTRRLGPKRAEMLRHSCILGGPQQRGTKSEVKTYATGHHDAPSGP